MIFLSTRTGSLDQEAARDAGARSPEAADEQTDPLREIARRKNEPNGAKSEPGEK
jgi:hypothetical protein